MENRRDDKIGLSLNDNLAFVRTMLANERTLLSYVRTSVGFAASSVALIKLFDIRWAHTGGIFMAITAVVILLVGIGRYRITRGRITTVLEK